MENKPTLEEVKEYFKNALRVRSQYNLEFDLGEIFKDHKSYSAYDAYNDAHSHTIWSKNKGYAEILTYKEKTFSITESQINRLNRTSDQGGTEITIPILLKEWFPEAFESEIKELKIGTWYNYNGSIVNYQGIESGILQAYGIRDLDKEWMNLSPMGSYPQKWVEATEQEVFEALKNEAVKRGFVGNQYVDITPLGFFNDKLITGGQIEWKEGYLNFGDKQTAIFKNGVWGKVLDSITLSEAEQQLKKKIIV